MILLNFEVKLKRHEAFDNSPVANPVKRVLLFVNKLLFLHSKPNDYKKKKINIVRWEKCCHAMLCLTSYDFSVFDKLIKYIQCSKSRKKIVKKMHKKNCISTFFGTYQVLYLCFYIFQYHFLQIVSILLNKNFILDGKRP